MKYFKTSFTTENNKNPNLGISCLNGSKAIDYTRDYAYETYDKLEPKEIKIIELTHREFRDIKDIGKFKHVIIDK